VYPERKRAEALEALLKKEREWDRQQREAERLENLEWLAQYNAKKSGYYVDEDGIPTYDFLEEDDEDIEIKYEDPA